MSLLVQKYGGTSVGSIERIKQVAAKIVAAKRARHDIVVVVSAMAGETNRLLALAMQIAEIPDEREKDVLLASGEQVSVALLTLALKELGSAGALLLGPSGAYRDRQRLRQGAHFKHRFDQDRAGVERGRCRRRRRLSGRGRR